MQKENTTGHRACVVSPGRVAYGDGTSIDSPPALHTDLLAILNGTVGRFTDQATVVVDEVTLSTLSGQSDKVRAAGWDHSSIGAWTLFHRADGRTVALGCRSALYGNQVGALFAPGHDAGVVAMLLDRYHAATGTSWRGTYVTSALAGIRLSWENPRYQPRWTHAKVGPGYGAGPLVWSRPLSTTEREWGYVHSFDTRAAYLASAISADVAWSALHHTGPQLFDAKIPGYWLVELDDVSREWLRDPTRPPLFPPSRVMRGDLVWITTPMARFLEEIGDRVNVVDSWTGVEGVKPDGRRIHPAQSRVFRKWGEALRDALVYVRAMPAGGMRDALEVAVKRTYKDATGGMQRAGMRVARADWAHTLIDLRRATMLRICLRVHRSQGVWPVEILTDSLAYADCVPSPKAHCSQGFETLWQAVGVRSGVGGMEYDGTVTADEWITKHAPRVRASKRGK